MASSRFKGRGYDLDDSGSSDPLADESFPSKWFWGCLRASKSLRLALK